MPGLCHVALSKQVLWGFGGFWLSGLFAARAGGAGGCLQAAISACPLCSLL